MSNECQMRIVRKERVIEFEYQFGEDVVKVYSRVTAEYSDVWSVVVRAYALESPTIERGGFDSFDNAEAWGAARADVLSKKMLELYSVRHRIAELAAADDSSMEQVVNVR